MLIKKGLVGVDLGYYYTKVVHLENKKGIIVAKNLFKERTPDGVITPEGCNEAILGDFLKSIFSEHKVRSKNVAFGLNSSFVITKTLNMPLVVDEEIEQAVMWEAEQYAPVGMDQVNVSYQVLKKDKEKNEMSVLIAITKKEIVESYKSAFKLAKLKLNIIDVDVFATANAFMMNDTRNSNKHNLIVDLGYSSTKIIFLKDGYPTFTRYMDFNFSSILKEATEIFDVKEEEVETVLRNGRDDEMKEKIITFVNDKLYNLYIQLQNSISFYNSSVLDVAQPIDNIVFTGVLGVWYDYLNIDNIREMLKSDIIQFNPLEFISKDELEDLDEAAMGRSAAYAVAVGLALRGVSND